MKKFILSIDQGTTSSRVVLYDSKFNKIDSVQKEFTQYFPKNGWIEHDALEIWHDIKKLIKKILKNNKLSSIHILSIGIANQRETTVLWNKKNGKPIINIINTIPITRLSLSIVLSFLIIKFFTRRSFFLF